MIPGGRGTETAGSTGKDVAFSRSLAGYNAAGQLLSMAAAACCYSQQYLGQSFAYNAMQQLTGTSGGGMNIQYNCSATQNNGKIISQVDMVSGEQVNFTYDALNRLATAQTAQNSNVAQWGQSFTYDGFGNLTSVNVIAGSAPTYSANYNAATNQQYSDCADANGNLKAVLGGACTAGNWYDVENRVITPNSNAPVGGSGGSETFYYYSYAPGNKRVWRGSWVLTGSSGSRGTDIVSFYAPNGQKLAEYSLGVSYGSDVDCEPENPTFYATPNGTYYYFGGRMIKNENGWVYPDRLGSIGKFYPYGQERPSATTNGTEKFTGYFRDAETGLDYADQRYESPGTGRFLTPDRFAGSASVADPGSWNRYTYVRGDPVNRTDARGMNDDGSDGCSPGFIWDPGREECSPEPPPPPCFTGICQGGGGGGQAPGDPLTFPGLYRSLQDIAGEGTQCHDYINGRFRDAPGHGSLEDLATHVKDYSVFDVSSTVWATATMGQLNQVAAYWGEPAWGADPNQTASGWLGTDYAGVPQLAAGGASRTTFIISSYYYGFVAGDGTYIARTVGQKEATNVHEMLHLYTGLDDNGLAAALGLTVNRTDASTAISRFLESGCTVRNFP